MFTESIRFKIILWYMLALTVTLGLFSAVLYGKFMKSVYEDVDDILQSRAEGIISSIDTFWEIERMEAINDGMDPDALTKVNNINFIRIAQRWVEEKSNDPKLLNIIIEIFDAKGALIASSNKTTAMAVLPKKMFASALKGRQYFDTINAAARSKKSVMQRFLIMPVVENDKLVYIVKITSPLVYAGFALKNLKVILFFLLPLTVFLTGIVGVFLAKIALRPVDKMIQTVQQISSENMKVRIKIPDTKDEIKRLADTFNDMIDRLENSFISQKQFIEDITHELKTPIAVLKGELEVALKRDRSHGEYESILRSNLEEVNKINGIVEDLLLLGRLDSDVIALDKEKLNISSLIKEAAGDMSILAARKDIEIADNVKEGIYINGDKKQLKRVFMNILDNAIKYSPPNSSVSIIADRENDNVNISISDEGIGIFDDEIPYIFDRFYRSEKSRTSSGFGLGLSIAKSVVNVHKGSIKVRSKSGQGSTFIVSLPLNR